MPRYVIHNPTSCRVPIPGTGYWVEPRSNLELNVQAMVLDTPGMHQLIDKGHLRVAPVTETYKISNHIEIPVVEMISNASNTNVGWDKIGIELVQQADPRQWRTPDKFVHIPGGQSIEVFHQAGGRRLQISPTGSPQDGDYVLGESGGVGTGYDTVTMLSFTPKALKANYRTI